MRRIVFIALTLLVWLSACAPGLQGQSDGATLRNTRQGAQVSVEFSPGPQAAESVAVLIGGQGLTTSDARCEKRPSGLLGCKLETVQPGTVETITVTGQKVRSSATFYRPASSVLVFVRGTP